MRIERTPERCANAACENMTHQGPCMWVETETNVVDGNRPIKLWLCTPCARGLQRYVSGQW